MSDKNKFYPHNDESVSIPIDDFKTISEIIIGEANSKSKGEIAHDLKRLISSWNSSDNQDIADLDKFINEYLKIFRLCSKLSATLSAL